MADGVELAVDVWLPAAPSRGALPPGPRARLERAHLGRRRGAPRCATATRPPAWTCAGTVGRRSRTARTTCRPSRRTSPRSSRGWSWTGRSWPDSRGAATSSWSWPPATPISSGGSSVSTEAGWSPAASSPIGRPAGRRSPHPGSSGRPLAEIDGYIRSAHRDWPESGIRGTLANFEVRPDGTVAPWLTFDHHIAVLRGLWEHHPSRALPGPRRPGPARPGRRGRHRLDAAQAPGRRARCGGDRGRPGPLVRRRPRHPRPAPGRTGRRDARDDHGRAAPGERAAHPGDHGVRRDGAHDGEGPPGAVRAPRAPGRFRQPSWTPRTGSRRTPTT